MKFLVTGLCFSQNLGGAAMAISLVDQIKRRIPEAEFVFSVDGTSYAQEKKWADYYGMKIVHGDNCVFHFFNTNVLLRSARIVHRVVRRRPLSFTGEVEHKKVHEEFMEAYRNSDAIISMRGISYVGDGTKGRLEGLLSYSDLHYAHKIGKPFTHFVQSFGPFDDWKVRYFARKDFNHVEFIPARGKATAKYCREIIDHPEKVHDFPDIAILLPMADNEWTRKYLEKIGFLGKEYVILSPSSVIHSFRPEVGGSTGKEHIRAFYLIARDLLCQGKHILFLPHAYSEDKRQCDREICRNIVELLEDRGHSVSGWKIVEEDLDPWQAKALIAKSKLAVLSRYHAIVAAVSTCTPVIAIGWNIKYQDIMEYYGIESMAIDARNKSPEEIAVFVSDKIKEYGQIDSKALLSKRHEENVERVVLAFELLALWVKRHVEQI